MVTMDGIEEDVEVIVNVEVDGDVKSGVIRDIVIEEKVEVKEDNIILSDSWRQVGCSHLQRA